jgi:hypothetical protein
LVARRRDEPLALDGRRHQLVQHRFTGALAQRVQKIVLVVLERSLERPAELGGDSPEKMIPPG